MLLWALQHLEALPDPGVGVRAAAARRCRDRATAASTRSARTAVLRPEHELEAAWLEADAWFGATEGRTGEDATLASIAAERFRALSWLRDASAAPA